ncbi:MAG TPA: DUF5067 domain-containing protein [Candidatus Blautia excrementipullorum]|nr:DUF5067 domain-containing protein [Candidatus Blautia excrementipullorum]
MDKQNQQQLSNQEYFSDSTVLDPDAGSTAPLPVLKKKKKKKKGFIIFLVILILAVAAGAGYYFFQRQKPVNTVKEFLNAAKAMDFEKMSGLLQNNDMTVLDNADITNAAYTSFFSSINQKMNFDISKTNFNILNGTANVTAHITYIDGSDIYRETITEFLRQIVSTAFSGEQLTEEQTQQKLAALLEETASSSEDKYTETDITYPLIKAGNTWKIVSLDANTAQMMSANFTDVQDEINESLVEMENADSAGTAEAPQASAGDTIDMSNEKFTIHYKQHRVANDFSGAPCLLVYYDYSNNGSSPSSAMVDVSLQAYQNGQVLSAAIPEGDDEAIDQFMTEVQPGQAVTVCQAFSLIDESDVTLQAGEAFSLGGGTVTTQILQLS